ncbi:hypothetical protein M432DRAFT_545861 [Thermoascus aurantiacus ATCC 26904]
MTLNESAKSLFEVWFEHALFLLTKPPVPASTEALQSYTILAHLLAQIDGFSGTFNLVMMSSLRTAREMRIHRLDTPRNREGRRRTGADMVDIEIKRRMWWHLVSSDWLLANIGGPQEGTYMLHPLQMETRYPSNIEDDAIPTGITYSSEEKYDQPLSTPTSMTYFIFRIKLATLSREVVDHLPASYFSSRGADSSEDIYNTILLLDRKFQSFLKSLPPFFQLNCRKNNDDTLFCEKPYLDLQRSLLNFAIHTLLARLHRSFLIRGSSEPKFAYSRMQCIRSAETVLEIYRSRITKKTAFSRFFYVHHHVLMAAVALAMDFCFNPDEVRVEQRKADVLTACRLLEEDSRVHQSSCGYPDQGIAKGVQKAVQCLRVMLKKHKDKEPDSFSSEDMPAEEIKTTAGTTIKEGAEQRASRKRQVPTHSGSSVTVDTFQQPGENSPNQTDSGTLQSRRNNQEPYQFQQQFDDLWNDFFSVAPTFDAPDWDNLLTDLDSHLGGVTG